VRLTTRVHDRDAADMTYVYPVVSRRARGVSIGINLNTNNACNWRCAYCQVPGLTRGKAPVIDLAQLEQELRAMLEAVLHGTFLADHVPPDSRRLNDIAFSGNGEPTSSPRFSDAVALVRQVLTELDLLGELKVVLITNGSLVHKPEVTAALAALATMKGEVWFKVDRATDEGIALVNDVQTGVERSAKNLLLCARTCPTWIQTMIFARNGEPPPEAECAAYVDFLRAAQTAGAQLEGVLLYGLARPSLQPEAPELAPLPAKWMEAFANRIRATGLGVDVFL